MGILQTPPQAQGTPQQGMPVQQGVQVQGQPGGQGRLNRAATQQGQPGTFPANEEDVKKFRLDIVKAIHSPAQQQKIIQILRSAGENIGAAIGQLAGMLIMTLVQRRMIEQNVKVPPQLAIYGASFAIAELVKIAKKMGIKIDMEQTKKAIQVAGMVIAQASAKAGEQMKGGSVRPQQPQGSIPPNSQGPVNVAGASQRLAVRPIAPGNNGPVVVAQRGILGR